MVVGKISYGSANLIFQRQGAKLLHVPVDEHGVDVQAIEQLCQEQPVRLVYVTPHHHYPTTVTMPAERRLRLLQLAQQLTAEKTKRKTNNQHNVSLVQFLYDILL